MLERLSWCKHVLSWLVIAHICPLLMLLDTYVDHMESWPLIFHFRSNPTPFFFVPVFSRLLYPVATQFISCQSPVGIWTCPFPLITDAHRPMFSISTGARSIQVKSSHLRMYVPTVSGKIKVISRLREVMLNTKTSKVVYSDVILCCKVTWWAKSVKFKKIINLKLIWN